MTCTSVKFIECAANHCAIKKCGHHLLDYIHKNNIVRGNPIYTSSTYYTMRRASIGNITIEKNSNGKRINLM